MISKGDWGIGYLAGTGISLVVLLLWWFAIRREPTFTTFVGTTTGIILSVSLVYLAYWLTQSELDDDHIWAVARWGAIGLAIPALPIISIVLFGLDSTLQIDASVLVSIAAASAVIGALFGAVTALEEEHLHVLTLHRRNVVLNRVLRHDVRNDAGVLLVIAERLEEEFVEAGDALADPIRQKSEEIIKLSELTQGVEDLDRDMERRPIDLVELVEDKVNTVRSSHPAVDIDTDLPEEARVHADKLLRTVIDNLIENAIEHNDRSPEVRVSVQPPDSASGKVELTVADNGPGLPQAVVRTLSQRCMPALNDAPHDISLGLWLVKWFVDNYDGELSVEENVPRGTVIRIALPNARPRTRRVPRDQTGVLSVGAS